MNFLLLAALSNAGHHDDYDGQKVKIVTKAAGGHKYKFNSKYFSVSEAFKHVLKKDKPSNQCEPVGDSLVIECPEDYDIVKDVRYPFCEKVTLEPYSLTCTGIADGDDCYELTASRICPEGFYEDKKLQTCNMSIFGELDYVCPDEDYMVMDGSKGKYCEKTIDEIQYVCPSGAYRDPTTDECMDRIPILPPICPDGFELSEDSTYCFRDITRPCGKHDFEKTHVQKEKGHKDKHLRRLAKKGEKKHEEKKEDHKLKVEASKHKVVEHKDVILKKQHNEKDMHIKAKPDMDFHDKFGYKESMKEKYEHVKASKSEGKKVDFVQSRLVDRGLCTYQEISPPIPAFETVVVPEVEEIMSVIDMKPVERVCEAGFDLVEQKTHSHKEPACVKTESADLFCPEGTVELNKMCYLELEPERTCPIGFRMTEDELFCTKSDIVPPKYQWLLARQCEGYKCVDYYEHSCVFK